MDKTLFSKKFGTSKLSDFVSLIMRWSMLVCIYINVKRYARRVNKIILSG